jgi:hypothetical protein
VLTVADPFDRAERGWLIESKWTGVPFWWNGMRYVLDDPKAWTNNSTQAIVFADWASASSTLNNLRVETMVRSDRRSPHAYMEHMQLTITEHEWPKTQSDTEEKPTRIDAVSIRESLGIRADTATEPKRGT